MVAVAGTSRIPATDSTLANVPPVFARLSELLDEKPESLAFGDQALSAAGLAAAKYIFDRALKTETEAERHISPFLDSLQLAEAPKTRSQTRAEASATINPPARGKGKTASSKHPQRVFAPTQLDVLHIDGAGEAQIWAQLDLRAGALCDMLSTILEEEVEEEDEAPTKEQRSGSNGLDDDGDLNMDDIDDANNSDEEKDSDEESDKDSDEDSSFSQLDDLLTTSDEEDDEEFDTEHTEPLKDHSSGDDNESDSDNKQVKASRGNKPGSKPPSSLDDGFFSLASFNAETEAAESRSRSSGRLNDDSDEDDSDEDVDLFTPVPDSDSDVLDEGDLDNSTELYYKDFFDPPSRKGFTAAQSKLAAAKTKTKRKGFQVPASVSTAAASATSHSRKVSFSTEVRVKNIKPSPLRRRVLLLKQLMKLQLAKAGLAFDGSDDEDEEADEELDASDMMDIDWDGLPDGDYNDDEDDEEEEEEEEEGEESDEDTGRETISRIQDDLFADEDDGPSDLSTHEKRQAELRKQIEELEQQNIGPKDWTLMGEAAGRARPSNSLLEQDLEYDRTSRPVPAVTAERVASLEDLIKKRILDENFDDVVRKLSASSLAPSARRGAGFELIDQKSKQSLAQLYEEDFRAQASGSGTSVVDDKLAKEHAEIEKMWEDISYKLDAMSNAHFTPKQPKAKITTISDVAAASIESALPTSNALSSMLAPEEITAQAKRKDLTARSELTPQEKRAARLREKKQRSKQRDAVVQSQGKVASKPPRGRAGVKKEKERALNTVVKGKGVTVVGKEKVGKGQSGKGKDGRTASAPASGPRLKL
ncbi:Mpp10 protein [Auriculariales sp. MPI-PUGE-AT-0066]|nr:Mpp10 protein [Auriculariales sp. MPI-PUGE-AT-0066]